MEILLQLAGSLAIFMLAWINLSIKSLVNFWTGIFLLFAVVIRLATLFGLFTQTEARIINGLAVIIPLIALVIHFKKY